MSNTSTWGTERLTQNRTSSRIARTRTSSDSQERRVKWPGTQEWPARLRDGTPNVEYTLEVTAHLSRPNGTWTRSTESWWGKANDRGAISWKRGPKRVSSSARPWRILTRSHSPTETSSKSNGASE